jgi:hypothetical protein
VAKDASYATGGGGLPRLPSFTEVTARSTHRAISLMGGGRLEPFVRPDDLFLAQEPGVRAPPDRGCPRHSREERNRCPIVNTFGGQTKKFSSGPGCEDFMRRKPVMPVPSASTDD